MHDKCIWNIIDQYPVKRNFHYRCVTLFSDMLWSARFDWISQGRGSHWIGLKSFQELISYWDSHELKEIFEMAKK